MEHAADKCAADSTKQIPLECISEMLFEAFFAAGQTFYYDQDFGEPLRSVSDH